MVNHILTSLRPNRILICLINKEELKEKREKKDREREREQMLTGYRVFSLESSSAVGSSSVIRNYRRRGGHASFAVNIC